MIDSVINWLFSTIIYWSGYLDSFMLIVHMKHLLPKSSHSAAFPIALHDLILLSSFVCRVQTTKDTIMLYSLINSVINLLCFNFLYWYGYLDSFMLIMHMKQILPKNNRAILSNFLLFSMTWYCLILLSAVSKRQDVRWCSFDDRFLFQISMYEAYILVGLSRLLGTDIAYEMVK